MSVVLVMFKDDERRDFPLKGSTVVGRGADCGLRVPKSEISRQHCKVSVRDEGVKIRDLDSANGTFVNGKRVEQAELSPGDKVTIGGITFMVQIDGKPEKITPFDLEMDSEFLSSAIADELGGGDDAKTAGPGEKSSKKSAQGAAETKADKPAKGAKKKSDASDKDSFDEDEIFELGDEDFDMEDAIAAFEEMEDDEDDMP